MYSKTSLMALCAAAAVREVAAGRGHQHMHANKREIVWAATETVVVTDWVTVTVTEGEEPTVAAVPTSVQGHRPAHHSHSKQSSAVAATTTSTIESSTSVFIEASSSASATTATPTTMITAVKPTTTTVALSSVVSTPSEVTSVAEQTTVAIPTTTSVASTTTSAAATATTSVVSSSGGNKRGLAFNDASLVQEYVNLGGAASWAYNWGSSTADLPSGITYYPMLWSPASEHSNGWDGFAKAAIANGADALLSFNEPDIASQANMSPAAAAAAHIQWMNPYAGQARISTPAISSSENSGQGLDWLKQFFAACNGQCKFDFCAAHWYGPGDKAGADAFLSHLQDVQSNCDGKPVWVTEFAAESGSVDVFMQEVVEKLATDDFSFVEKYSYFMAGVGELFSTSTSLSSYGKIYAGI
ncbi:glycosyl hydrolase catalytic core-domain-containing protein [Nemania sp. FL0031]|nr:glycosyl hydrolase catalytic core-domain-containing protein [Nemania sp. FL0031]